MLLLVFKNKVHSSGGGSVCLCEFGSKGVSAGYYQCGMLLLVCKNMVHSSGGGSLWTCITRNFRSVHLLLGHAALNLYSWLFYFEILSSIFLYTWGLHSSGKHDFQARDFHCGPYLLDAMNVPYHIMSAALVGRPFLSSLGPLHGYFPPFSWCLVTLLSTTWKRQRQGKDTLENVLQDIIPPFFLGLYKGFKPTHPLTVHVSLTADH